MALDVRASRSSPTERVIDELFERLGSLGSQRYGLEPVSQLEHALQCAHLAQSEGAHDELIGAALLHDIGHLMQDDLHEAAPEDHAVVGAALLSTWFGPALAEPVSLHAQAKRYLVATEPTYYSGLSVASRRSLRWQGGAMTPEQAEAFCRHPYAKYALRLRVWDDRAKDRGAVVPRLNHYRTLLERLLAGTPLS
jgi:phosphonate degradation associated HDIG domain protein